VLLLTATQQCKRKEQLRFHGNAFGADYMPASDMCRSAMLRELQSGSDRSCLRIRLNNANARKCYVMLRFLSCAIKIVTVKSKDKQTVKTCSYANTWQHSCIVSRGANSLWRYCVRFVVTVRLS
jgi:hypothetical protein